MLASQGLDYRTTKKILKPKLSGSLKDFLLASDKQFDIKLDIRPKAPKNHDSNVLVYDGPFGVEHADLLVTLLKACSGEVMGKLEERVRNMTKEQVDLVIQALRSCPEEVVGKLAEQFSVITSEDLDRLSNMIKRPMDILGEMDLQASVPLVKSRKVKVKGQKAKSIIPEEMETNETNRGANGEKGLIEENRLEHGHLNGRELNNLGENPSLVEIKTEKDADVEMEPKSIQNYDDKGISSEDKKIKVQDLKEKPSLVEREKKKGKCQKKMEIAGSEDERVDYNHKFPSINPRFCITFLRLL